MPISQVISTLPTPPSTTDPTNFDTRADAFLAALPTLQTELNTYARQANSTQTAIGASEANAATSASSAATSAQVAAGAANFQGPWDANTNYQRGQSVSYLGQIYLAQQSSLGSIPTSNATNWLLLAVHEVIRKPVATTPANGATAVSQAATLTGTAYAPTYSVDSRSTRQFQVTLQADTAYASPVFNSSTNADSIAVTPSLAATTAYRWRCRDTSTRGDVSAWSNDAVFLTGSVTVSTPTLTVQGSPSSVPQSPLLTTSAFATSPAGQDTHASTSWFVRRASDSAIVHQLLNSTSNLTSYTVPSGILLANTSYIFQAQHNGTTYGSSAVVSVTATTLAAFDNFITTPTATPAAFGDAFEGGFYAGLIWNQLVQSTTSQTIATGSKTFTVPDMAVTPIVYGGQILEVRSRANPANRMRGTVTGATGTQLTINVTTVNGSGTFTDWSIMSRYRVIISPKATGDNASLAYKTTNDAAPTAAQTLTEGFLASVAMNSAAYPAAQFCRGLTINGRSDWYLPARDELELLWRNLKPTTDNNYINADRPTGASFNYANLGSFGDTENTHGTNNNSDPAGAAYTTTVPAQTAATAFRTGGAEAMTYASGVYYWSASEYSATTAWSQLWFTSGPGYQGNSGKSGVNRVRAVRRSII